MRFDGQARREDRLPAPAAAAHLARSNLTWRVWFMPHAIRAERPPRLGLRATRRIVDLNSGLNRNGLRITASFADLGDETPAFCRRPDTWNAGRQIASILTLARHSTTVARRRAEGLAVWFVRHAASSSVSSSTQPSSDAPAPCPLHAHGGVDGAHKSYSISEAASRGKDAENAVRRILDRLRIPHAWWRLVFFAG